MKFSIESGVFMKMLRMLEEASENRRLLAPKRTLQLGAADDRVWLSNSEGRVAEAKAEVWKEGECLVSHSSLLRLLRQCTAADDLLVEADAARLHVGERWTFIIDFSAMPTRPEHSQIFLAADVGLAPAELASIHHCRTL